MKNRDEMVLTNLIGITTEVESCIKRLDCTDFSKFINDDIAKRAITMCLISLSENVDLLTEEFKNKYNYINWRLFKALRNIAAHKYGSVNFEMVWEIANKNLPKYKIEFERLLKRHLKDRNE